MFRSVLKSAAIAAAFCLAAGPVAGQVHHQPMPEKQHGGCDLCAPRVYLDGAALWRVAAALPSAGADKTTPLVRGRLEVSSFVEHVGLFSQMEFTPADGPTPSLTFGIKFWALSAESDWNVTGGLGLIDYRQGIGETSPGAFVSRGWGQIGAQYHTPLHELSIYAQAGVPFSGTGRVSYQLGASHPIAPYKLHLGL